MKVPLVIIRSAPSNRTMIRKLWKCPFHFFSRVLFSNVVQLDYFRFDSRQMRFAKRTQVSTPFMVAHTLNGIKYFAPVTTILPFGRSRVRLLPGRNGDRQESECEDFVSRLNRTLQTLAIFFYLRFRSAHGTSREFYEFSFSTHLTNLTNLTNLA